MRRSRLSTIDVKHPETGRLMQVKCMSGGGFNIVSENPADGQRPMTWVLTNLFSGGLTGTSVRLLEIEPGDVPNDED